MAEWGVQMVQSTAAKGAATGKLPFMKTMGLDLELDLVSVADGEAIFVWETSERLVSMDGIVQGGVLSVVADICQGHTFMSHLSEFHGFSTSDLETRFIQPIRAGECIEVSSKISVRSSRLTLIDTVFSDDAGVVRATARGGWRSAKRAFAKSE